MSQFANSIMTSILRRLYGQTPILIGKRCLNSTSRKASTVSSSACLGGQKGFPAVHLISSQKHTDKSSSRTHSAVSTLDLKICLNLDNLCISEKEIIYGLNIPSIFNHCLPVSNKEIRDNPRIPSLKFELPKLPCSNVEITTPTRNNEVTSLDTPGACQIIKISPGQEKPMKYANSTTLRMKHKRMKKHQLRRLRQKYWAEFRKQRMRREARKKKMFEAEIAAIKKEGEVFDAEAYVKEKLAKAQRGGYMINILETAREDKAL